MRPLGTITDPTAVRGILEHLGVRAEPRSRARARDAGRAGELRVRRGVAGRTPAAAWAGLGADVRPTELLRAAAARRGRTQGRPGARVDRLGAAGSCQRVFAAACVATVIGVSQYYLELVRLGSGDFCALEWKFEEGAKKGAIGRAVDALRWLSKKDFFIFAFLVMAVFGALPYALFVAAFGAVRMCVAATTQNLSRLLGRVRGPAR